MDNDLSTWKELFPQSLDIYYLAAETKNLWIIVTHDDKLVLVERESLEIVHEYPGFESNNPEKGVEVKYRGELFTVTAGCTL